MTMLHCYSQSVRIADYKCVDNQQMQIQRLIENKQALRDGLAIKREISYVPVKFHLVADNDGLGRADIEDVLDQLCALNIEFEDTGLEFYIDNGFNLINNSRVYESPTESTSVAEMIRQRRRVGSNSLNVFITLNAREGERENGTVLGFYAIENDWIVIRRNQIGNGENTLAHEIGHYFSLRHPHAGWENDPWEESRHGNPVLINRVNGVQIELVDGSNCDTAGDQLCDTPPDYNFGLLWDSSCPPFNLVVQDRNRDTIVPQQNNYMSYFIGCGPYEFTSDQSNVMMAEYNSGRKESIRTNYIPNQNEVGTTLELLSPGNNTTTDFHNGVELRWTAVENAETYYLEMRSGSSEIIHFVEGTEIYITELLPNKTYTWSITPYNEAYTCADKKSRILNTNDETTSTIDPDFVESVNIFPNPIQPNELITMELSSNAAVTGVLKLFSVTGKLVYSEKQSLLTGKNSISLDTNHIKSGLYMLSLATSEGNIDRKIIITNH